VLALGEIVTLWDRLSLSVAVTVTEESALALGKAETNEAVVEPLMEQLRLSEGDEEEDAQEEVDTEEHALTEGEALKLGETELLLLVEWDPEDEGLNEDEDAAVPLDEAVADSPWRRLLRPSAPEDGHALPETRNVQGASSATRAHSRRA
jgi:hypothetical protein